MKSQKHASHTGMCTYTSIQQSHTHTYIVTNMSSSYPINIKRKQAVVIRAPRLDGDNMPSMATTLSHKHTQKQNWSLVFFLTGSLMMLCMDVLLTDNNEDHTKELNPRT